MFSLICAVVIILVSSNPQHSMGYRWLPLKSGDPIPEGAISIGSKLVTYVGRARHYNSVLPAEIYTKSTNTSYGLVSSCSKEIVKNQFEVLTATEDCEWKQFTSFADLPANVVRAGTAQNGEPIFIGSTKSIIPKQRNWNSYIGQYEETPDSNLRIASIFMTTDRVRIWEESNFPQDQYYLVCDDDNNWVDTLSAQIPNNTISGGKSEYDHEIFVGRLLNDCAVVPGVVTPSLGIATAVNDGEQIESSFCQVLVGDEENYRWVSAKNGEIPDYAVVGGIHESNELMYVARVNKTLGYVLYKEVAEYKDPYEILIKY